MEPDINPAVCLERLFLFFSFKCQKAHAKTDRKSTPPSPVGHGQAPTCSPPSLLPNRVLSTHIHSCWFFRPPGLELELWLATWDPSPLTTALWGQPNTALFTTVLYASRTLSSLFLWASTTPRWFAGTLSSVLHGQSLFNVYKFNLLI